MRADSTLCRATSRAVSALLLLFVLLPSVAGQGQAANQPRKSHPDSAAALRATFLHPPDDARIMVRWWWFGPAVTHEEIRRELEQMKEGGIGGVELTSLYAQALDDPATGFRNFAFASPEHVEALGFAARTARALGLRVDLTLGSGWPYGGPQIPVTLAAGGLRVERIAVPANATQTLAPSLEAGESRIAAFLVDADADAAQRAAAVPTAPPLDGRYRIAPTAQDRVLIVFIASRTGMMVKRPAVGDEGFVLDHYDRAALAQHLKAVGVRLISAFGDHPPHAVFSDSLEVYASDWTPHLLDEFQKRRGYDLKPHLLALVTDVGPQTAAIRHDWGQTLTELVDADYLRPLRDWAHAHGTQLRAQVYGYPPVNLASNVLVDLPEGEGKATFRMAREFSDTRWAASAGHLFHRNVISSETWTWLHSPAFRATPLDMKAEADLHFIQGINQLVGHGWPYSPPQAGEPGWRMYAAAALNAHNPWYFAMPKLTGYLQRVSWALRQGSPVMDVAVLLPDDDAWASFHAVAHHEKSPTSALGFDVSGSNITIDEQMGKRLGPHLLGRILDAGFNPDFADAEALNQVGVPYRALLLPGIDRIPVATYERILAFARHGGVVVATRRLPATAPGLIDAAMQSARIQAISRELFSGSIPTARFLPHEAQLGATLVTLLRPDVHFAVSDGADVSSIGWIHRRLPTGDLYFLANTSNTPVTFTAQFRDHTANAEMWNPYTGAMHRLAASATIPLQLAAYDSRLIFFARVAEPSLPLRSPGTQTEVGRTDLSHNWQVAFPGSGPSQHYVALHSWTDDPATRSFSGSAMYTRSVMLSRMNSKGEMQYILDFGKDQPLPRPSPPGVNNMKAYLDPPVREVAHVFVNGHDAGVLWRPPWRLDVTQWMHSGTNQLRIVVANTAINRMASEAQPNLRLLRARYGTLFEPQDMQHLQPIPSGLLGPVTLIQRQAQAGESH